MTTPSLHERAREDNSWVERFKKAVYEPEHTETTCWCEPKFLKQSGGNLEIVHNEQRDVLTEIVRAEISRAKAETLSLSQEAVPGEMNEANGENSVLGRDMTDPKLFADAWNTCRKETLLTLSKLR